MSTTKWVMMANGKRVLDNYLLAEKNLIRSKESINCLEGKNTKRIKWMKKIYKK